MQPNVNSIHFLWAAYLLVAAANIGHALWLRSLWVKLNKTEN
ncbi:hypothetical protein Terro_1535 [Terriglobus roseus DSM 18391]|uniref:Uncharacterized protein n=1 Tax=Terriglobus roseus (strain DSM 18391 / NRRL B-41598 / KBS 63) TaxID=926566 RepID=I3ZF24_TERRK|nr:hypothetical protein [Terriglobus roseus]AFL87842.1 hypothetical protein Terro_1535 [Terriglobus roseus DSM 18391]